MKNWAAFVSTFRQVVAGAIVLAEILDGILSGNERLLKLILKENSKNKQLKKLVKMAKRISKTMRGRVEVSRLADEYRFESSWPTDDITLRRVYDLYRNGELGKRLPAVNRRIA